MNRWLYILLLLAIADYQLSGQRLVPTPDILYSDASEFMYSGDYSDALDILLTLYNRGYHTANINYLIGECYLNIQGRKTRSLEFLKEAVRNISVNYSGKTLQEEFAPCKALLYLGISYRLNYDFENALRYFNEYIQNLDDSDLENIRSAEYHIERCIHARELMASPSKISCDTLTVLLNRDESTFNPLVTADEKTLLFMDQLKFYDAVMLTQSKEKSWSVPENITPKIQSDGDHYITGMTAEGNQILLTCYDPYQSGEIYTTDLKNGEWTPLQKLGSPVNTVFNESHASFSPDGKVLYFTSDRKGGYGGSDIYRIRNENGEWGKAVNLGPFINTPYNEESPFVTTDGSKLFFSSQGHYNMGGFDIFCSDLDDEGDWLPPVNIGYPLNTTDDDIFYFPVGDGKTGYQSRYSGNFPKSEIVRYVIDSFGNPERFMVNGKVDVIADPGFNRSEISVAFVEKKGNITKVIKPLNEDGSFRQKLPSGSYKIDFSENSKILMSSDLEIPDYFPYNNLAFHEELSIPSKIISDTVYLNDILFDFNTSKPGEEYSGDIERIADIIYRYPEATVRINGYADAIGGEGYNLKLSMKRANSIKEILENRIEMTLRTITVPHGEKDPVALNSNADGSDNPEGRHYNRRVRVQFDDLPDTIHVVNKTSVPPTLEHK